ncbi:MAG: hypothetical protein IPJ65_32690 [Archangiaceae bacterium]|nr:hypothetical protein [Archangiaceae bacterium]
MRTTFLLAVLFASLAHAEDAAAPPPADAKPPPPADEIKHVLDYFYNGKDRGPALVEIKACLKVDSTGKDANTKNECVEPVTGPVKKDTTVHGWTMWYLPEGANYDDVSLQFIFGNDVRSTIDVKLSTPGRTRTWRSTTASKKGKWTIKVKRGDQERA